MEMETKRLTVQLPKETHAEFKAFCSLYCQTMSEVVTRLVREWLEKREQWSALYHQASEAEHG